jgi:hypothetical protein
LNKQAIVYFIAGAAVTGSAWITFVPESVRAPPCTAATRQTRHDGIA